MISDQLGRRAQTALDPPRLLVGLDLTDAVAVALDGDDVGIVHVRSMSEVTQVPLGKIIGQSLKTRLAIMTMLLCS